MSTPEYTSTPVRRVVTGHTDAGKSKTVDVTEVASYSPPNIHTRFSDVFWTEAVPCNNSATTEFPKDVDVLRPTGSMLRVVDIPPGAVIPMHRTVTLDYAIVTNGSIVMVLEEGESVVLKTGDVVVQRGTVHSWRNEGAEWVRIYCVMLPSNRIKVGDAELDQEFRRPAPPV